MHVPNMQPVFPPFLQRIWSKLQAFNMDRKQHIPIHLPQVSQNTITACLELFELKELISPENYKAVFAFFADYILAQMGSKSFMQVPQFTDRAKVPTSNYNLVLSDHFSLWFLFGKEGNESVGPK